MAEAEYGVLAIYCCAGLPVERHEHQPDGRFAAIDRLSTVKKGYWPPLSIIGHVTYAPLSGVYECPLCSHGPRGPVGV